MTRRYGEVLAIEGLDLRLAAGEGLALLGPNGAGKSTVLELAAGMRAATEGDVRVLGKDPASHAAVRGRIGYLPHLPLLADDEGVARQVEFHRATRGGGGATTEELLAAFGVAEVADECLGVLSAGMRRRSELAAAVAGEPDLVLLDEPLASLDREIRGEVLETVREFLPRAALLMATHAPAEARRVCARFLDLGDAEERALQEFPPAGARVTLADPADRDAAATILEALPGVAGVHPVGDAELEVLLEEPTLTPAVAAALAAEDLGVAALVPF